jgi:hypothetical protein
MCSLSKSLITRHVNVLGINHFEIVEQFKSIFLETNYLIVRLISFIHVQSTILFLSI